MANFYSTTQRVDFGCILFSNEPVSCTPKFLNCWMGPGQASTQDQSVQALMIHLCELKKCVGTLQWTEPQSTLRQKIPTRIGCIHTRLGGYRVYGLNPELEQFHPFPRFRFFSPFFFHPKSLSGYASLSPASSFPSVALLPVSTQIPPVAPLAPFLSLPPLSTLLSNDSAHLRLPRSPVSTSALLATDILRNHPQPCFYLWQTKATRFSICFSGFWIFIFCWISWSTFHLLPRFHCSPASSFDQNWEKTPPKIWRGIASNQSGFWFQMKSTEFARSNWWPKSSCFDIWNHLPGSLHSLFKERVSTWPRQYQKSPDQPYQNILPMQWRHLKLIFLRGLKPPTSHIYFLNFNFSIVS